MPLDVVSAVVPSVTIVSKEVVESETDAKVVNSFVESGVNNVDADVATSFVDGKVVNSLVDADSVVVVAVDVEASAVDESSVNVVDTGVVG